MVTLHRNFLWGHANKYIGIVYIDNLAISCDVNINWSNKIKYVHVKKIIRSRLYHAETMTDVDYAYNRVLLTNLSVQADFS